MELVMTNNTSPMKKKKLYYMVELR